MKTVRRNHADVPLSMHQANAAATHADVPTGPEAAAILAAGIGCAALGLFAFLADAFSGIATFFEFYPPAGPLVGTAVCAIAVWLASWFVLASVWADRDVPIWPVGAAALLLLAIAVGLAFPALADLFQGR